MKKDFRPMFTEEKIEKINLKYNELCDQTETPEMISLTNGLGGTAIKYGIMAFCNVDELTDMIDSLVLLKKAITEETGLIV